MPSKKDTTKKGSTHDNMILEMLRKNRKKRNPDEKTVKAAASMKKKPTKTPTC